MSTETTPDYESMLVNCVHWGLCLQHCPTYIQTGDENNSPRGRLQMIRAIEEKRVPDSDTSDFYIDECVGCLACMSACPANVPYEDILLRKKAERVENGKPVDGRIKLVSKLVTRPKLFNALTFPVRLLRNLGIRPSSMLVDGSPALTQSSAAYARHLMQKHQPTGPVVGLLTGCLMEATYREINFATIRVLIALGFQVRVPEDQTCCGAVLEHSGLPGKDELSKQNNTAFSASGVEVILTNSSGCGLALQHGSETPVEDVLQFIAKQTLTPRRKIETDRIYVDQPCHLVHGQRKTIPQSIMNALGAPCELAPMSTECCGAGGTYNITHEDNSNAIINRKTAFLEDSDDKALILATANHICMQQWQKGLHMAGLSRKVKVRHLIQLMDQVLAVD